jgi:hypothetical protein
MRWCRDEGKDMVEDGRTSHSRWSLTAYITMVVLAEMPLTANDDSSKSLE